MNQPNEMQQLRQELHLTQRERELYRRLLELSKQEDLKPLLQGALGLIVEVTRAQRGYLALYHESDKNPHWWIVQGFSEQEAQNIQQKISSGVIAATLSTGETIAADAAQDPRLSENESVQAQEIRAVLCAPIGIKRPIGVLYLQGKPSPQELFSASDTQCAELFSQQLAPLADRLLMKKQNSGDATEPFRQRMSLEQLSGQSAAMARVFSQVERASRFELTVLLRGPSGTGKTAVAKTIHKNSARAKGPFLELNCATIPESLFESELFGAAQGAHSTATKKIQGKLTAAEGGTLFLDEVGELPLIVQAKLLQFLQSKEYFPLGATKPEKANVRLITATNLDLEEAVRLKKFREDLFYRLQVMTIHIPSLSERRGDIAPLIQHFCKQTCEQHNLGAIVPSAEALLMAEFSEWPGNVRQLANAVEVATISAAVESSAEVLSRHLFPESPHKEAPQTYQEALRGFQRKFMLSTLNDLNWNVSDAAKRLDLNRSYLYQLLQSLGVKKP